MEKELKEIPAAAVPKTARIAFDDETFQKLILGETLQFDLRSGTNRLEFFLDPRSKYRMTYMEVLEEAMRTKDRGLLVKV